MNIGERRVASPVTQMANTDSELEKRGGDAGGVGIGGLTEVVR